MNSLIIGESDRYTGLDVPIEAHSNGSIIYNWTDAFAIDPTVSGISWWPQIAIDLAGNIHVVWYDDANYLDSDNNEDIFYRRWNASTQQWTTTELISTGSVRSTHPAIATDSFGNAHVAWMRDGVPDWDIFYRSWNAITKTWNSIEGVCEAESGYSAEPEIAVDGTGNVHLTWHDQSNLYGAGTDGDIFYRCRNVSTGAWSGKITGTDVISVGSGTLCYYSSVAVDQDGNVHVTYDDESSLIDGNPDQDIFYRYWNSTTKIWNGRENATDLVSSESTGLGASFPTIVVDGSGNMNVVWRDQADYMGSGTDYDIFFKSWNVSTKTWTETEVISNGTTVDSSGPDMKLDSEGNIHVVWQEAVLRDVDILYKHKLVGTNYWTGYLNSSDLISYEHSGTSILVAIDIDGADLPHVVYSDNTYGDYDIYYKKLMNFSGEPGLHWNQTWGDAENNVGVEVEVDGSGNAYIFGQTYNTGISAHQAYLAKFDVDGNEVWNTTLGRGFRIYKDPYRQDLAWDGGNYLYLTWTWYTGSDLQFYYAKYDLDGNEVWTKSWGGGGNSEYGQGVMTNGTTNFYIVGSYWSSEFNLVFKKYDTDGNEDWSRTFGGSDYEWPCDLVMSNDNYLYILGYTDSYGAGEFDFLLLKYNESGDQEWYRTWGGVDRDWGYDIAIDGSNNLYLVGFTKSLGAGESDAVIIKYDSDGNEIWNRTWGGSGFDEGKGITIDSNNNLIMTGSTSQFGAGENDTFYAIYNNTDGDLLLNGTWGGSNNEYGEGIAYDGSNLYLTGFTESFGAGQEDAFLLKYGPSGLGPGGPPDTTIEAPINLQALPSWNYINSFNVSWTNPFDQSGIVGAYYKLDSPPVADIDGIYVVGANIQEITGISVSGDGVHPIYVWLNDSEGNVDFQNRSSTTLYLNASIRGPIDLVATPSSWANTNSFNISWINPPDPDGIVGVYYKLDAVPTSDTDGIYVAGADIEEILDINVVGHGAHPIYVWLIDSLGNVNYTLWNSTTFFYDANIEAPTGLSSDPSSWSSSNLFNISWTNPAEVSGIIGAYYKYDSAPTFDTDGTYVAGTGLSQMSVSDVPSDGTHDVYVWLADAAGNIDYNNNTNTTLYLDTSILAPISLSADPSGWTNTSQFNVSWSNPADLSDIVGAYYRYDSAPSFDTDGTYVGGANLTEIIVSDIPSNGSHEIYVWLRDTAGTIDFNNYSTTTLYSDSSIKAPISLSAEPSSWTNVNLFNVSWTNPIEDSGIVGAYYKYSSAPIFDTDGTYVAGVGLTNLSLSDVPSNGTHDVYVWLRDAVGNVDYNNYNMTTLFLDATINAPFALSADPSGWSYVNGFNVSWTNPIDPSGIVGAYYKLDSLPVANDDGTYVLGSDINEITGISVSGDGAHTIYVWLNDSLGNIDFQNRSSTTLYLNASIQGPNDLTAIPGGWSNLNSFNLSWNNPADPDGIVGAYYKLDAIPTSDTDGTYVAGADIELILDINVVGYGAHPIYVWLRDSLGYVNHTLRNSTTFYYDANIEAPSGITADPISWNNLNSFNVSWTNPAEVSGIIGTYYKYDSAPTFDTDGTYVAGVGLTNLSLSDVPSNGTHDVYVWLVDAAGNIDYNNNSQTTIYLDTAILAPISVDPDPDDWTTNNLFNVSWSNPGDISGIIGAYYKVGSPPSFDTDGNYVAGIGITQIFGITVPGDGMFQLHVWLVDAAGNNGYTNYVSTTLYLDTIAPTPPSDVISNVIGRRVLISWLLSGAGDVDHYNIYRSGVNITTVVGLTPIASVSNTTSYYYDSDLNGGTYYYVVTAVDKAGQESVISNSTAAIVPVDPTPFIIIIIIVIVGSVSAAGGATTFFLYRRRSQKPYKRKMPIEPKKPKGLRVSTEPARLKKDDQVLRELRARDLKRLTKEDFSDRMYTTYEIDEVKLDMMKSLSKTEFSEEDKMQLMKELFSLPKEERAALLEQMSFVTNREELVNSLDEVLSNAENLEKQNSFESAIEEYSKILSIAEGLGDDGLFQGILQKMQELELKNH